MPHEALAQAAREAESVPSLEVFKAVLDGVLQGMRPM